MTFEEFKNIKTVNELNSCGISITHSKILPKYYNDFLDSKNHVRMIQTDVDYICSTSRGFIKYLEVDCNDDKVCFIYESLFFCNPPQLKVYELPVSKNGNKDNVIIVLNILIKKEFKITLYTDKDGIDLIGLKNIKPDIAESNFYDTYDFIMGSRYTQKMKTKYRFKYLDKHCHSEFYEFLMKDKKEEVIDLRKRWEATFPHKVYSTKYFLSAVNYYSANTFNMLTYYDDELVHYNKVYVSPNGAQRVFSVNAARFKTDDEERNKNVYNIDRYTRIPLLEHLKNNRNVNTVYHLSTGADSKDLEGLYYYKSRVHEGCIDYYKIQYRNGILLTKEDI